jgi:hypothetical protein
MLVLDYHHNLKANGVKVLAVGPGTLETDLGGARDLAKKMGLKHSEGGLRLIEQCE